MFQRVSDLFPRQLVEELLRLVRLDRNWVQIKHCGDGESYEASIKHPTWLRSAVSTGSDAFGLWAASHWLADGPKVFRPTRTQCQALEQIEVRLHFEDYAQPYPALLVDLPDDDRYSPFLNVLCFKADDVLVFNLNSKGNMNDVNTTISRIQCRSWIEESIQRFDESCRDTSPAAVRALRVAANSCLALLGHGIATGFLFPREVESDRKLGAERTDRGERARLRLPLHVVAVAFEREVILHRTATADRDGVEPTGQEKAPHWRRGHWRLAPCGSGRKERRRVLIRPVLVRADLFIGDKVDTMTVMRSS